MFLKFVKWFTDSFHLQSLLLIYSVFGVRNIAVHLHLHCKITIENIVYFVWFLLRLQFSVQNISYWCRSVMEFFLPHFLFVYLFVQLFCVMLVCYCSFTIPKNMCNHLQPLTSVWHTHIHRLCFAYEIFQFFLFRKQSDVAIVKIYWFFLFFPFTDKKFV